MNADSNPSRQRPRLISTAAAGETAFAVLCFLSAVACWLISSLPGVVKGKDAAVTAHALRLAMIASTAYGVLALVAAVGLWRMQSWARWLAVALYGFLALGMVCDPMFGHEAVEMEDLVIAVIFIALTVLYALPSVGRALRTDSPVKAPETISAP